MFQYFYNFGILEYVYPDDIYSGDYEYVCTYEGDIDDYGSFGDVYLDLSTGDYVYTCL